MRSRLQKDFDEVLKESIEEALTPIFGKSPARTILSLIQKKYHVNLNRISNYIPKLSRGLRDLLGTEAPICEDAIVDCLCRNLHASAVGGGELEERIKRIRSLIDED